MGKSIQRIAGVLLGTILYSRTADAAVLVNTWENFDPIYSGLKRMALLFSDNSLVSVAYAIGMAGLSIGALTYFGRLAQGSRSNPLAIFFPTLIGAIALAAVITPKNTVILYDRVTGQYGVVPDVPAPVATLMSWTSQLESKMISMIDQSAPPGPPSMWNYSATAGGANIDIIMRLLQSGGEITDSYFQRSVDMYISNCAFWAIGSGALNTSDLKSGNIDLAQSLAVAANPGIYTVVYSDTNPQGVSATCSDAWNNVIQPGLSTGRQSGFVRLAYEACNSRGWPTQISSAESAYGNDSNIPSFSSYISNYRCLQLIGNMSQLFTGENTTPAVGTGYQAASKLARHVYLSKRMMKWADEGNVGALGSFNQITDTFGGLTMVSQWMPAVRGALYGFMYALLPFAFMFSVTGVAFRALFYVLGGIAWLMIWNVMDAMATSFTLEYAYRAFQEVREHQLGLSALAIAQPIGVKVMTAFARMKIGSALFATSFMFIVFRFGGNALTAIASGFQNTSQSYGSDAERKNTAPVEQTAWRDALARSDATQFAASSVGGWGNLSQAYSVQSGSAAIGSLGAAQQMGGVENAANGIGHANTARSVGSARAVELAGGTAPAAEGFAGQTASANLQGQGAAHALASGGTRVADNLQSAGELQLGETAGAGDRAETFGEPETIGEATGAWNMTQRFAGAEMANVAASIGYSGSSDPLLAFSEGQAGANVSLPVTGDQARQFFSQYGTPQGMTAAQQNVAEHEGGVINFSTSPIVDGASMVMASFRRNESSSIDTSGTTNAGQSVSAGVRTDGQAAAMSDAGISANAQRTAALLNDAVDEDTGQVNAGRLQAAMESYTQFLESELGVKSSASASESTAGGPQGGVNLGGSLGGGSKGSGGKSGSISVGGGYSGNDIRRESGGGEGRGSLSFTADEAAEIAHAINGHAQGDPVAARMMLHSSFDSEFIPDANKWVAGIRQGVELSAKEQTGDIAHGNLTAWQKAREINEKWGESFDKTFKDLDTLVDNANHASAR